jgi:ubiquinone/menaquinone biosynthesis C-methylase UbiE
VLPDIFWEIHSGLPREGPGDDGSTRRAYAMAADLPPNPRILDIGCGPGMQTLELTRIAGGFVAAVDLHLPFLQELRIRAKANGLGGRIVTVNASMAALPFADASFDLIWSEGAMYFLGFREALAQWKRLLVPRGYVAVTEPCWLNSDPPDEVKALFADYPAMTAAESWLPVIAASGCQAVGHFTLQEAAWWDNYYAPMTILLERLRERHKADPAALSVIAEHEREIEAYRKYSAYYGYVFFVLRLV